MCGMWGAWGIVMMLFMFVFWGLVITGLVLGIRWLVQQGREADLSDAAVGILRQRYARGNIDKEEFLARKRDLLKQPGSRTAGAHPSEETASLDRSRRSYMISR